MCVCVTPWGTNNDTPDSEDRKLRKIDTDGDRDSASTMADLDPAAAGSAPTAPAPVPMSTPATGSSILSDKVSRALEVRTDTPAMRAALEALSDLPPAPLHLGGPSSGAGPGSSGGGGGGGVIDARSVRVAIERDALRQALLFEEELRALVGTVADLRLSVSAVSKAASRVSRCVEASVVVAPGTRYGWGDMGPEEIGRGGMLDGDDDEEKAGGSDSGEDGDDGGQYSAVSAPSSLEEDRLAAVLCQAFRARDEAARRAFTISAFLDRFDLSDSDAYLLDHYTFDEFDPASAKTQRDQEEALGINLNPEAADNVWAGGDGPAFLDALERVRRIRSELVRTFGDPASSSSASPIHHHGRCKKFLRSDERLGTTSALRMMEGLAARQERAYGRLYHFLQTYLELNPVAHVPTSSSGLGDPRHGGGLHHHQSTNHGGHFSRHRSRFGDDDEAMDEALFGQPFVRRSLYVLRHVPAYRSHTLELIASVRRSEVTRRFLLALTSGYSGLPPIEMSAHDPVVYVGDMLAFAFRSCSVEVRSMKSLKHSFVPLRHQPSINCLEF